VLAVPTASSLAILDLEHGVIHTTTPFGARVWADLVRGVRLEARSSRRLGSDASQLGAEDLPEDVDALAGVADYLLDRRLIEPVSGR
jgi:hypothetical protein